MSGGDIDTRSDIYALGVLLYELVTGHVPFEKEELLQAGLDEMRRLIREQEPVKPSTRLSALSAADLTTVAKHQRTEPPKLLHQVRGDLDWIVMKYLAKDRNRRYETANGLAMELSRFLNSEPILARPPSNVYRLQKAWRRNHKAFTAATLTAVVLVAATGISAWEAVRATRAETLAKQRLTESEAISKLLREVFQSPDPSRNGHDITVAETLSAAAKKLETDLADQPARRANLQATLAATCAALGLDREAIPLWEKVRDYYLAAFGPKHTNTLMAMHNLGISYHAVGRQDEAIKLGKEVLALRGELSGPEHPDTLKAMNKLADYYESTGRRDEALKLREEVLALCRKVSSPEHREMLHAMQGLASSYYEAGRRDEALKLREEVLALYRRVCGSDDPDTLSAMNNLALSYAEVGRRDEALKLQEEVLALYRKTSGLEHPSPLIS